MEKFNRLINNFNFNKVGIFKLSDENKLYYELDADVRTTILYAIVVEDSNTNFLRYVGISSHGLEVCIGRIKTGSQQQPTNHRLKVNILQCLKKGCKVSIYCFVVPENQIAKDVRKQINDDRWKPDWNENAR